MSEPVLLAILSLVGTLVGTFAGIVTSGKLTSYRIEQLEKKVEKFSDIVNRVFDLEGKNAVLEERIDALVKRVG